MVRPDWITHPNNIPGHAARRIPVRRKHVGARTADAGSVKYVRPPVPVARDHSKRAAHHLSRPAIIARRLAEIANAAESPGSIYTIGKGQAHADPYR
jgi:hypothetical protein